MLLDHEWRIWARADQLPPVSDPPWRVWLVLGGRGAGKTRTGAEWVRARAANGAERIAILAETLADARAIMVEGPSGLLALGPDASRPTFEKSTRRLIWPSGAVATLYSASDPDSLRGPQFSAAWCDEAAKWPDGLRAWDMLQFGLRLGDHPQVVVTTTPRPVALIRSLLDDPATAVSRARTADNAAHLAPGFLADITARYGGTALGRQELDGEVIADIPGALWTRAMIEAARVAAAPELIRVVVAVDPAVTGHSGSDATGIIAAGLGADGRGYVLADCSVAAASPSVWARAAIAAFERFSADRLVVETNQGGDLVTAVLRQFAPNLAIRTVTASVGKRARAEPIAALYEQGRVGHVGAFAALEDEMCQFAGDGSRDGPSPDRLDALVYALSELMLARPLIPRVYRI